jgi:hypothetical protein
MISRPNKNLQMHDVAIGACELLAATHATARKSAALSFVQ